MKRITISILLVMAMFMPSLSNFNCRAQSAWECTALPAGSAKAEAEEDSLYLSYATTQDDGEATAIRGYDLSENGSIYISFKSKMSTKKGTARRQLIIKSGSKFQKKIININGSNMLLFDEKKATRPVEDSKEYQVDIGLDKETGNTVVWLDSQKVYEGSDLTKWSGVDYSDIRVLFQNTSNDDETEADWEITNYTLSDNKAGYTSAPENGNMFAEYDAERISIKYLSVKSPATYEASNYELLKGSEAIDFTVERKGAELNIIPKDGFLEDTQYTVKIKTISDLFLNTESENEEITFKTAGSDYERAQITISTENTEIYDSQTATVAIDAKSGSGIDKITVYSDGSEYLTLLGDAKSFEFSGDFGTHTLYAEVLDLNGAKATSQNITINVLHNDPPKISVSGIASGGKYDAQKLSSVLVSASDTNGIASLFLEVGDIKKELVSDTENLVDLSTLSQGIYTLKITAEDMLGAKTTENIPFTVKSGYTTQTAFESDFNSYSSEGDINPGIVFTLAGDAKILSDDTLGEEHGTAVVFKTDGGEVGGKNAGGSWGRIPTVNATDGFIVSMDMYLFDDVGSYEFYLKNPATSPVSVDVTIKNGVLSLKNKGGQGKTVKLDTNRWYKTVYQVDIKAQTYSYWLDDELIAEDFKIDNPAIDRVDVRLVMTFTGGTPKAQAMAFDNMKIEYITPIPQITSVTGDDKVAVSKISPYSNTLNATVNVGLSQNTVNRESVQLYCGNERVYYDSVDYDTQNRVLSLTLSEKLRSDHSYRLVITNKVTMSDGTVIPDGISVPFDVSYNNVDVSSLLFDKSENTVKITGDIYNSTGKSGECYLIISVVNGKRIVNTAVKKINYTAKEKTGFVSDSISIGNGDSVRAYIWSSLKSPKPISSRIYTMQ